MIPLHSLPPDYPWWIESSPEIAAGALSIWVAWKVFRFWRWFNDVPEVRA